MGKPLSWKWKITLASVGAALFVLGYIFTDGCNDAVVSRVNQEFMATPENERRNSAWAGRYFLWGEFKGSVCGDYKVAAGIFKDFCGLPKEYEKRAYDYCLSPAFTRNEQKMAFKGKCSANGLTGWGPMHPDAPDVFYEYLTTIEPWEAGATTGREAKVYWILFYDWYSKHSPDHKPHPKFLKYWVKVRQKMLNSHVGFGEMNGFDYEGKRATPWKEPE